MSRLVVFVSGSIHNHSLIVGGSKQLIGRIARISRFIPVVHTFSPSSSGQRWKSLLSRPTTSTNHLQHHLSKLSTLGRRELDDWFGLRCCYSTLSHVRFKGTHTSGKDLMDSSNDTSEGKGETLRPTPRRVTFSGIQPTGIPHIGNYIGALKSWLRIQDDHHLESGREEVFYSIVGLHSLTIPRDPARLRKDRFEMMCCLLAIGLKPNRCCLFNQDDVPAHSELAWILGCLTSVGKLNRMTTWKSKIADSKQSNSLDEVDDRSLHLGLLSYPVLQTADILLYRSTQVPVGADQEQHIELTRSIAKSFNKKFRTNLFPLPRPILTPQAKILNLRNPIQKMSKSSPSVQSRILITDSPQGIRSKITSAVTDSIKFVTYDPINRPGISNLLDIYRSITGEEESMSKRFEGRMADELKSQLVDVLVEELRPIQVEFERLQGERTAVEKVFELGAVRANAVAQNTLKEVKLKIGLL